MTCGCNKNVIAGPIVTRAPITTAAPVATVPAPVVPVAPVAPTLALPGPVPIPTPAYPPGPAFTGNFPLYNNTGYLVYPSNYPAGAYTGLWNLPYFGYGGYGPYGNVRPTYGTGYNNGGVYSGYATSAAYGTGTCGAPAPVYNGNNGYLGYGVYGPYGNTAPNFSDAYNPTMGQYFNGFSSDSYLGLPGRYGVGSGTTFNYLGRPIAAYYPRLQTTRNYPSYSRGLGINFGNV